MNMKRNDDKVEIKVKGTIFPDGSIASAETDIVTIEIPRERLKDYDIVNGIATLRPETRK